MGTQLKDYRPLKDKGNAEVVFIGGQALGIWMLFITLLAMLLSGVYLFDYSSSYPFKKEDMLRIGAQIPVTQDILEYKGDSPYITNEQKEYIIEKVSFIGVFTLYFIIPSLCFWLLLLIHTLQKNYPYLYPRGNAVSRKQFVKDNVKRFFLGAIVLTLGVYCLYFYAHEYIEESYFFHVMSILPIYFGACSVLLSIGYCFLLFTEKNKEIL